jgi:hypothetical protein
VEVQVSFRPEPFSDQGNVRARTPPDTKLCALQFHARPATGSTTFRAIVEACCDASKPVTDALLAHEYRLWVLLVGAVLSPEQKRKVPEYALSNPLRKQHLIGSIQAERVFYLSGKERTAGVYLFDWDKFSDVCWFQNDNSWSVIVLSRRDDFDSGMNLETLYEAAAFDDEGVPDRVLNWRALSTAICLSGDVVVKTFGAFDDWERAVRFVFAADNQVIPPIISGSGIPLDKNYGAPN